VPTIAVAVVHGSPPIREGLAELLGRRDDVRVVGTHAGLAALTAEGVDQAQVVLCDLEAARAGGAAVGEPARLLVFNVADEDRSIIDCVRLGASGCVLQDADLDELAAAIASVAQGRAPSSARIFTSLFRYVAGLRDEGHPVLAPSLTEREEEVLRLVAEGLGNREIAARLGLRLQTVKNHVHRVFEKLDVHSRNELLGVFRSRGEY
jgi:DNA-binding NarL/FixJ family response regulator